MATPSERAACIGAPDIHTVKTILLAVLIQAAAPVEPSKEPTPNVMASVTAEFDSKEACVSAGKGLGLLGDVGNFTVLWGCAPKDIAKLEVEKKPKNTPGAYQVSR